MSNSGTGTLIPPAGKTKNFVGSLVGLGDLVSFTRVTLPPCWPVGFWGACGGSCGCSVKWSATKFTPGPDHSSPSVHSWPRATGDWGDRTPLAAIGALGNVFPRGCLGSPGPEGTGGSEGCSVVQVNHLFDEPIQHTEKLLIMP